MADLVSFGVNWLTLSALYAMVAIGFTMIFGVGGVLNLGHGATITIGGLMTYYFVVVLEQHLWVSVVAAVALATVFNLVLYRALVRKLEDLYGDEPEYTALMILIMTLLVALVVEQAFRLTLGSLPRTVPPFVSGNFDVAGTTVSYNIMLAFVVSWIMIGALFFFVNYTRRGKALMAITMSRKGANLVGIDINRMYLWTWVIAGVLAAIAGVFLGSRYSAVYTMGRIPLVISFAIVVLGGLGSIKGSVLGAYVIGFAETFTITFVPGGSRLAGATAFVLLVIVLLVRPEGIYGRELQLG